MTTKLWGVFTKKGIAIGMGMGVKMPGIYVSKKQAEIIAKDCTAQYKRPHFVKQVTLK